MESRALSRALLMIVMVIEILFLPRTVMFPKMNFRNKIELLFDKIMEQIVGLKKKIFSREATFKH
jgi:hypothetical protein